MWEDNGRCTLSTGGSIIMDIFARSNGLKLKCIDDGFCFYNLQLFACQGLNWWTGIIVMFLSAVWTLILMASIHCRGTFDEQVMPCFFKYHEEIKHSYTLVLWQWVLLR